MLLKGTLRCTGLSSALYNLAVFVATICGGDMWCDENPPRVTKPRQNCGIVAILWVWVLSSLSIVSLYYSNVMHE